MLKPERLSRLPTKPLDRQRRPHPYHKSPGPQGRAWQGARRWQQSASLCHSCPFLRWSAHSWHVAAICRAGPPFADRNVTNVFNRRCMHAQMLISGQSSTNLSLRDMCWGTKLCSHVTVYCLLRSDAHPNAESCGNARGPRADLLRDARARHPDDSSRKRHGPYGS
jgi:hypothetical protein